VNAERVTFTADGLTLVGNLAVAADRAPAVVLTGPFTGVKEQVVATYATRLHERGLTTLAFDHRGFGESGGRRAHEDSQGKLADLRAAVSLLTAHSAVDAARVAAVGICLGGGYAVRAAATDPRIRAVVRPHGAIAAMGGDEPFAYYGTQRHTDLDTTNEPAKPGRSRRAGDLRPQPTRTPCTGPRHRPRTHAGGAGETTPAESASDSRQIRTLPRMAAREGDSDRSRWLPVHLYPPTVRVETLERDVFRFVSALTRPARAGGGRPFWPPPGRVLPEPARPRRDLGVVLGCPAPRRVR